MLEIRKALLYDGCMDEQISSFSRACELVGGMSVMAASLGVTFSAISQWRSGMRPVPADRCPSIERLTSGAVRCEDLRPDIEWSVLRDNPDRREAA
jgi:DNA-binding transcriptional regulator YdaS (Cro superfamily)